MKINFEAVVMDFKGKAIPTQDSEKDPERSLTLRDVCVGALSGEYEGEKLDGTTKLKRFRLADKIYGTKEAILLESEDVTLIKDLIAKAYRGTLIYGRCATMLDEAVADESSKQKEPEKTIPSEKKK